METIITQLREASETLNTYHGHKNIHFPELMPDHNDTESAVLRAARAIAKHGNQDKGHKVKGSDLAALIHYIADMLEE